MLAIEGENMPFGREHPMRFVRVERIVLIEKEVEVLLVVAEISKAEASKGS